MKEVNFKYHNYLKRAKELKNFDLDNLKYEKGKIVVIDKTKPGCLVSPIVKTHKFPKLTGCWSAITNAKDTIELMIQIMYKGKMSKYFTYGEWGLYGENLYYNQDDEFVRMDVDEILMKDNLLGEGFRYKVILHNDCKLSLINIALKLNDYTYKVKDECLPSYVDYDIVKLNQVEVPVIGHEMCSATTSTMLLKFKGFDFSDKDSEFEHRYVASLVADNGHHAPTYGNWVFNTAAMSAFGFDAYVARQYSWEELKYHLAKVGPVGASIKGDTGLYKTGGHLIVVRGYKIVDGKTYVLCNDPYIDSRYGEGLYVYYEFPLDVFMKFHRGVVYIVE